MTKIPKTILLIALEFHPCKSAGVQRPSSFCKELQKLGWNVVLLTAKPEIYDSIDDTPNPISEQNIFRVEAFEATKKFAIKGKYLEIMAAPDRYWPWVMKAIPAGKQIIKTVKPDLILSTYPSLSAHIIAWRLAKWSNLPWVADYRDPVKFHYENVPYPGISRWFDNKIVSYATKAIFTTERAKSLYQKNFPKIEHNKFTVIENGFDEDNFEKLTNIDKSKDDKFTLLHSGAVFPPNGRSPIPLFKALAKLKVASIINAENFQLVFRGGPSVGEFSELLEELNISELVQFKAGISYIKSLEEMHSADGLLVIQGALFDNQIPGKIYEYIRTRNPILGAVTKQGATAEVLLNLPLCYVGNTENELHDNLILLLQNKGQTSEIDTLQYSRQHKATILNELLLTLI